ncbi:LOW QUALITY PROTEIN: hypothetical protein U9M48_018208 [Paspalum notatum var. saurae]|uniref:Reverse transcriptase domain-containing protein n=1 Tax=Paspalum notatum var. saurae TaxID=547442 RepID=A0AAQ3TAA1_PASNO
MEQHVSEIASLLKEMQIQGTEMRKVLQENTQVLKEYAEWRPQVDVKVEELQSGVSDLRGKVDRLVQFYEDNHDPSRKVFDFETIDLTKPAVAHLTATSPEAASGPVGHGASSLNRGSGFGVVSTLIPTPVTEQFTSVSEYIERFDDLVHQILAYDPKFSVVNVTNRFVDGLRHDIRAAVLMHRPSTLDTACSLALLQEELSGDISRRNPRKTEIVNFQKAEVPKFQSNISSSYSKNSNTLSISDSKKGVETSKTMRTDDKQTDAKVSALMSYRRARGLCYKCGLKWGPTHKCATSVSLNARNCGNYLQKKQETNNTDSKNLSADSDEDLMSISAHAVQGTESPRTVRMIGSIKKHEMLMLIDSGSSHCFISELQASKWPFWSLLTNPLSVRVANGAILKCTHELSDCPVWIQNRCFHISLKILPLGCYDIILGIDWHEEFSPMEVDWREKTLTFEHLGSQVTLQGIKSTTVSCSLADPKELNQLQQVDALWYAVELHDSHSISSVDYHPDIQSIVTKFSELFQPPSSLPPVRSCAHTIPLIPGAQPFRLRPYRYNPAQKDEIERQVTELLRSGFIKESNSPFASPVLLVRKKTGDWRLCVDFRRLNALTVKNKFPLPVIDELLDELVGAQWFSTLDLASGFHQILMAEEDRYKTAFQTHHGHYEYSVMPYGVTGGPATFQHEMNTVLAPFLRKFAVVFIDDVLIYSKTWDSHLNHLQQVFSALHQHQFKVKLSKCAFAKQEISYLGYVVSYKGVSTDPKKIDTVLHWPVPTSVKELKSFLGLAGYYRKFVKNFGLISKPLNNLLKKGELYVWTVYHEEAFQTLKEALTSAPVLALPDFQQTFVIETDASDKGIGAVLQQNGHPIAFVSRALGPKSSALSTYEKECLAILLAVDYWRPYLLSSEFIIKTDQKSLVHLDDQHLSTPWQHKAMTKLLGLQYKICYKKGTENRVADSLSRLPSNYSPELQAISTVKPVWILEITSGYHKHPATKALLAELIVSSSKEHFTFQQGLIRYKGRIWLAGNLVVQTKVIQALHSSAAGGHSGVWVTYVRIKKLFAWPNMKKDIQHFVSQCAVCQQAKVERVQYPGLLQPLPVPTHAWQVVSLDFIEGLPRSKHYNCILVVVDKFSKYAHFIAMSHPFTAFKLPSS